MTKTEQLAVIDTLIAQLKGLSPIEREELDRMLAASHRAQRADDLTRRVLGK